MGRDLREVDQRDQKVLHKTLGRSHLSYEAFKSVIVDNETNLNNLTYVEAEGGEDEVLTPNTIL